MFYDVFGTFGVDSPASEVQKCRAGILHDRPMVVGAAQIQANVDVDDVDQVWLQGGGPDGPSTSLTCGHPVSPCHWVLTFPCHMSVADLAAAGTERLYDSKVSQVTSGQH